MKKSRLAIVPAVMAGVVLGTTTAAHAGTDTEYVFTKSEVNGIPAAQGAFFNERDRFWIEDTARDGRSAVLDIKVYDSGGYLHDGRQLWNTGGYDHDRVTSLNYREGYKVVVRACVGKASDRTNFWGCGDTEAGVA
jgi:hypothetical protein